MRKVLTVLVCTACVFFVTLTAAAQKTKNTMTNADVVEMVKAGLPESTIVLAIQQSEPNFDTSPKALIELKKQGVSQKILETMMLQPQQQQQPTQVTRPAPQNKTNNLPPFAQPPSNNSEGMTFTEVMLTDGEKRLLMKRSQPNTRGNSTGMIMNPFGKVKVKTALDGNHAQLRVNDTTPEFEISIPSDVNASDYIMLVKLSPKADRREVEVGRAGITGSSQGFRKESIMPITFEEVKTQSIGGGMKYTLYRVKVVSPLPPGEYALSPQGMYYDFGIDGGR